MDRSVQLSNRQVEKPMMGLRVPAGVVYLPEERPVDVFLELVPPFISSWRVNWM